MTINLVAPINKLSYGYVASEILYYLSKKNRVCLHPIGHLDVGNKYLECVQNSLNNQDVYETGVSLRIFHEFDLLLHAGYPRASYSFFEMDQLTERSIRNLKYQHLRIVPTRWAASVLNKYNIDSEVIPLGVSEEFKPVEQPDKPRFAIIGKFEVRKGHDVLPDIFLKAFPKDAELWCFTENPFLNKEETDLWRNKFREKLGSRVSFFPRQESIIPYLKQCHAGIFISRGEGWNLGCLEMMAMGKHVIATDYSGHTEYCNSENSYLIDIDTLEPAHDGKWFFGQGNWAKIGKRQEDLIIDSLRDSYQNYKRINNAGIETGKRYTFEATAERINGVLRRLSEECD